MTNQSSGHVVMVEWDGNIPPTQWYDRLHKYGLRVRGSKDKSPIDRRASDKGVVFQEGSIVCKEYSLAQTLAALAYSLGAKSVMVGQLVVDVYKMTEGDAKALNALTGQWGKRGPKSDADAGRYVVTCREEVRTFVVELKERPVVCPMCGGTHITWRKGDARNVKLPAKSADVYGLWYASRKMDAQFEIPRYDEQGATVRPAKAPVSDEFMNRAERALYRLGGGLSIEQMLALLDAAYCWALEPREANLARRVEVLREYYAQGGKKVYTLSPNHEADIVDIAGLDHNFAGLL